MAEVSANAPSPYSRPKVHGEGNIILENMRHPILENMPDITFLILYP